MVETNLPILFLHDLILFPYNELRVEFNLERDKKIIELSESIHDGNILLVNNMDSLEESPNLRELPKIAILAKIKSKLVLPNKNIRLVLVGIDRVEVLNYFEDDNKIVEAFIIPTKDYDYNELEATALKRVLFKNLEEFIEVSPNMSNNVLGRINGLNNLGRISDIIISELPLSYNDKFKYIEISNSMYRTKLLIEDLHKEIETVKLENSIESKLRDRLDEEQKNYILKEKIKLIKEEIGELDIKDGDVKKLKDKISKMDAPSYIVDRLNEEISRYELMPATSAEIGIIRNYIDWLINLPWNTSTIDNKDIKDIKNKLDESHYGLSKIKNRILEYIASKSKSDDLNSPIICLVGPSGVGKTTLAKSIANVLDRKFVKVSVGSIVDDAEIMGHRKTYIGAYPGKIIQGIRKCGVNNPVFLIDEIDKITKDYRKDVSTTLLDILDKEQNSMFIDNYIEEKFDLSKVMFILTANNVNTIPEALKDRLEIIELSSYTEYEKIEIARNYLVPKMLSSYKMENISISKDAIKTIINYYTKESGVRELERILESLVRKIILEDEFNKRSVYFIDNDNITSYLGNYKYNVDDSLENNTSGVVNTLAYTPYGGMVLKTSAIYFKGKGNLNITGSIGEVMKESVEIALSYIKSNCDNYGINSDILDNNDIHIHFESGSIPKDGPSAGITILTTLISLFLDKPVPNDISMTGEITLRGKILPVGGLKEKLIAAKRCGINTVFIPKDNSNDIEEIDDMIKEGLEIVFVSDYEEIYRKIFKKRNKTTNK